MTTTLAQKKTANNNHTHKYNNNNDEHPQHHPHPQRSRTRNPPCPRQSRFKLLKIPPTTNAHNLAPALNILRLHIISPPPCDRGRKKTLGKPLANTPLPPAPEPQSRIILPISIILCTRYPSPFPRNEGGNVRDVVCKRGRSFWLGLLAFSQVCV